MNRTSELLDRLPPQDLAAERAILGSCLLSPVAVDRVTARLAADDFYADGHRKIFQAMLALRGTGSGGPIDPLLLVDQLKSAGHLEAAGGVAGIAEIAQAVPTAAHAVHYAGIVADKAARRRMMAALTEALRDAYAAEGDPLEDILGRVETGLLRIRTGRYTGEPKPIAESVLAAIDRATAIMERRARAGLLTGIEDFDTRLGGLFGGELAILSARPRIGKTALACQIAAHVATAGRLTYFASLEMSDVELVTRMLCSASNVNSRRIRTGELDQRDMAALAVPGNELAAARMVIHDRPGLSASDVGRACRRLAREGLSLIVVDYLQRITPPDRRLNRYEQVAEICKQLKTLARELNVPVLCLAQLGREADKVGKPELHHLRESGDIEAEADVVAFLVRNVRWEKNDEASPEKAALIVEKNRNGETATLRLRWDAARTRFERPGAADMGGYEQGFEQYGGD